MSEGAAGELRAKLLGYRCYRAKRLGVGHRCCGRACPSFEQTRQAKLVGRTASGQTAALQQHVVSYKPNTFCPLTPVFTGTRQTRPTKKVTFPRNKAEESPFQQHDLSILIVGPNQLKHRLSRTNKPKSRHKTNTCCPLTRLSRTRKPKSHPSSNTQCPITHPFVL